MKLGELEEIFEAEPEGAPIDPVPVDDPEPEHVEEPQKLEPVRK